SVIGIGGVARKSTFIKQTLANVWDMTIKVEKSDQAPRLSDAIYAATVPGIVADVIAASEEMGSDVEAESFPHDDQVKSYSVLMEAYRELGQFVERTTMDKG